MRILIVDDDQEIRFALANVFQVKHKFTVVEACSGQEAIATLSNQKDFSLIISDYQMENGNGDIIIDYLKDHKFEVPFIFFSGSDEIKTTPLSAPILKSFAKSEVFHLIEYVEGLAQRASQ